MPQAEGQGGADTQGFFGVGDPILKSLVGLTLLPGFEVLPLIFQKQGPGFGERDPKAVSELYSA